jgi:5-methyltetrahydropteroyltriglutamate--homocysteine methyltransferase
MTTHVGSLTRPPEVLAFLTAIENGEPYDAAAFDGALDVAVDDVVRRQAEIGLDAIDDGEMGKTGWIAYLYDRVSGIEERTVPLGGNLLPPSRDRLAFPEFYAEHDAAFTGQVRNRAGGGERKSWVCTGPIVYDSTVLDRDIARFQASLAHVDVVDAFMPVVAPASVYWLENEHYESEEAFVFAVADALHEEYARIVEAGLVVQVDDAVLMHEYDSILALGGSVEDYRRWAELRIEALNHALRGIPEERVRYHVCFGSWHGPHAFDPPLADVLDLILKVNARYYLMEQANPRHEHEWRVWEDVALPDGKVLIPGVVTHHTNVVEHPEVVAERLVRLAGLVGRENVMGGTDCGFAQGAFVRRVHPTIQWAKLEALVEGARLATERLYAR